MLLLRQVIGTNLRAHREDQRRSLRDVAGVARVSLGYLSEIERGRKEASSELLASICTALDLTLADLLSDASTDLRGQELIERARAERDRQRDGAPASLGTADSSPAAVPSDSDRSDGGAQAQLSDAAAVPDRTERRAAAPSSRFFEGRGLTSTVITDVDDLDVLLRDIGDPVAV